MTVGIYIRILQRIDVEGAAVGVLRPTTPARDRTTIERGRVVGLCRSVVVACVVVDESHVCDRESTRVHAAKRGRDGRDGVGVDDEFSGVRYAVETPVIQPHISELAEWYGASRAPRNPRDAALDAGRDGLRGVPIQIGRVVNGTPRSWDHDSLRRGGGRSRRHKARTGWVRWRRAADRGARPANYRDRSYTDSGTSADRGAPHDAIVARRGLLGADWVVHRGVRPRDRHKHTRRPQGKAHHGTMLPAGAVERPRSDAPKHAEESSASDESQPFRHRSKDGG